MWKAQATATQKIQLPKQDDDWETDPDFVNDISERDQRFGNQKTIENKQLVIEGDTQMQDLRSAVINKHEVLVKEQWLDQNGKSIKSSYGAK
ncbi:hypothetical protein EDD86DRAFT_196327 [Gorgonomyces haynaldii]|nr:hypothetical protein EDD86DRAFT_196327 [Gorgonomyces haynaldii]